MKVGYFIFLSLLILLPFAVSAKADNAQLFTDLQNALQSRDESAYLRLVSSDPASQSQQKDFIESLLSFDYQRVLSQIADEKETQMLIHVFLEGVDEAKYESWSITTVLENGRTRIQRRRTVSSLTGLYRLRLSADAIHVKDLEINHFDATFHIKEGELFLLKGGKEVTGIVFIGDATLEFAPKDPTEKQQLTLFCKQSRLLTPIPSFYIRGSPFNIQQLFGHALQQSTAPEPQLYPRAKELAEQGNLEAFSVTIPLTNETWFPIVEQEDFLCLMNSSYGVLLYQYSASEKDVILFRKEKEQIVSLYSTTGETGGVRQPDQYKITGYKLRLSYQPHTYFFNGFAEIELESHTSTTTLLFKLNPKLHVIRINSSQGPLIYFQESQTKSIHLVLNEQLNQNDSLSLTIQYQGSIEPELGRTEAQTIRPPTIGRSEETEIYVPPSFLYSNQTYWYPQPSFKTYLYPNTSITVPDGYVCVSNGQLNSHQKGKGQQTFVFETAGPVKYLSLFIARIGGSFTYNSLVPIHVYYDTIDKKNAERFTREADKILRFYSDYFGPYPYKDLSLVLRPLKEPGGHAPGTFVIVNRVYTFWHLRFKRDPLYQPDFPMLILAHEIAHQWWGQAVGWRDYQDQWLSEGFAQFAAWEYIRHSSGDRDWSKLADIFSDWIEEKTYAGPLVLGARLGHLTDDPKAFSAILYHKGAYVLNMLKNWMGAQAFQQSLRDFYSTFQFRFADDNDFQQIAQNHSQQSLSNFFQQWLHAWNIPSVKWSDEIETKGSDRLLKLRFTQQESNFYYLRVPIEARSQNGDAFRATVELRKPLQEVELRVPFDPQTVLVDPLHENLMKSEKE